MFGRVLSAVGTGGMSEYGNFMGSRGDNEFRKVGENNEFRDVDPNGDLARQAQNAGNSSQYYQQNFNQLGQEAATERDALRARARGEGPSLAAMQLRSGLDQNIAAQQSAAAAAPPGSGAMAARNAMNNANRAGVAMSGQAAQARLMEQQQAQQQLNNMLMQQSQQNLQGNLQSQGQALQGYGSLEDARTSRFGTLEGAKSQRFGALAQTPTKGEHIMGGLQGAAGIAMMSDKRLKENIEGADSEARKLLRGLRPYSYDYKDQKHGKGRQFGIMAQDLEKAGGGAAVIETSEGKAVHGAKLAAMLAGALGSVDKRLSKLERD